MSTDSISPPSRSSSPAAQRMRRYRKQRRQGLRSVRILLDETDIDALIRMRLLKEVRCLSQPNRNDRPPPRQARPRCAPLELTDLAYGKMGTTSLGAAPAPRAAIPSRQSRRPFAPLGPAPAGGSARGTSRPTLVSSTPKVRTMKTLVAVAILAMVLVPPALAKAKRAQSTRAQSAPQQGYQSSERPGYYHGYPLSEWYRDSLSSY
jgi:hypothetical protein